MPHRASMGEPPLTTAEKVALNKRGEGKTIQYYFERRGRRLRCVRARIIGQSTKGVKL